MKEGDEKINKLRNASQAQIEIGKILESFDPVLRPLDDIAKHGITLSTIILGMSASVLGTFASEKENLSCSHLLILLAWGSLVVAIVAGSIQLYRLAEFRESIKDICHVVLGKELMEDSKQSTLNTMKTPQKNAIKVEFWALGLGVALFVIWAAVQVLIKLQVNA